MSRLLASLCLATAVVALGSCNDDDTPTAASTPTPAPNPSPSPSGCTQTTLATETLTLDRNALDATPFTTTAAARVDITVDWQNADSNVGAFVAEAGACTPQRFNNQACPFLLQSGDDKPHVLSADLPAGSYDLLLNYFGGGPRGSNSETATVEIVQSTGSCSPSS
jgi:hypothetical protein